MAAARVPATYEDVLRAPEHQVAELIDGELFLSPRPAKPHAAAMTTLAEELGPPFKRARGGPGGWILLVEPEIHFDRNVIVPDLAGWRRERMPVIDANEAFFTLAPDWICEVQSPSTRRIDRMKKLPLYARAGVAHAWLVDPLDRTLEVLRRQDEHWLIVSTHEGEEHVRAEPFDALALELGLLWADVVL